MPAYLTEKDRHAVDKHEQHPALARNQRVVSSPRE